MKNVFLLLLAVLGAGHILGQEEPSTYQRAVKRLTSLYNADQPDSIYRMFGTPMTDQLAPAAWKSTFSQLRTQLGNLKDSQLLSYSAPVAEYKANFERSALALDLSMNEKNQIIGLFFGPLKTNHMAVRTIDPSVTESPYTLKSLSATIRGTLTLPRNVSGKIPVVLIIAGSGPTDRNGNSTKLDLETNAYQYLAEGLGKNGIASVRYDKRMVGASETNNKESDLRFDDYVDDAVGLIQMLSQDERFSKVIVLGHSEGSLIGMLACRDEPASAFISVAGAGQQADKLLTEQLRSRPDYMQQEFKTLLDSMKKGKTIDNIDPRLYFIARPSIQRYLMSWFRYDPPRVLKTLKIPILIIQGTTDLQVQVSDAEKLKKAKSDASLLIIPGMNHIMKDAPADRDQNLATYNKPELPLKAELLPAIVQFVQGLK